MKRLTLCKNSEKQFLGVCGGIAEYLNTDPTLIRLATVLLCLTTIGILPYFLAYFIMPPHPQDEKDN